MSTTMTIRLESSLKYRLDQLAEVTHRSKSFLAAEAIKDFIDLNEYPNLVRWVDVMMARPAVKKSMEITIS